MGYPVYCASVGGLRSSSVAGLVAVEWEVDYDIGLSGEQRDKPPFGCLHQAQAQGQVSPRNFGAILTAAFVHGTGMPEISQRLEILHSLA